MCCCDQTARRFSPWGSGQIRLLSANVSRACLDEDAARGRRPASLEPQGLQNFPRVCCVVCLVVVEVRMAAPFHQFGCLTIQQFLQTNSCWFDFFLCVFSARFIAQVFYLTKQTAHIPIRGGYKKINKSKTQTSTSAKPGCAHWQISKQQPEEVAASLVNRAERLASEEPIIPQRRSSRGTQLGGEFREREMFLSDSQ